MSTGKRKGPDEHSAAQDNTKIGALDLVKRCAKDHGNYEFQFIKKSGQLDFLDGRRFKYDPCSKDQPILDLEEPILDLRSRFWLTFSGRGIPTPMSDLIVRRVQVSNTQCVAHGIDGGTEDQGQRQGGHLYL